MNFKKHYDECQITPDTLAEELSTRGNETPEYDIEQAARLLRIIIEARKSGS